VLTSPPPR